MSADDEGLRVLRIKAARVMTARHELDTAIMDRDWYACELYGVGDYTVRELARNACVSHQRLHVIVREGSE